LKKLIPLVALMFVAGCDLLGETTNDSFPSADRDVAPIVSSRWSNEESRDRLNESEKIMDMAGIAPNMTVADIGAGEGYYTIRLAARVGPKGRVLAQDIIPAVRDKLAERVSHDGLDNVSVKLGEASDPKLPENSFDRILLVHVYHEISSPYEFLWRLRPALRAGGRLVVVDSNRATKDHGTPAELLSCELAAVGFRRVDFHDTAFAGGYYAAFEATGARPEPQNIKPCSIKTLSSNKTVAAKTE
jgi:SAM-dependent methyltransferase